MSSLTSTITLDLDDLDVEDLNYVSSSEELGIYTYKPPPKWKRGLVVNLAAFAVKWLRASAASLRAPSWRALEGKGLLAAIWSLNQHRSLEPILHGLEDVDVLSLHRAIDGPLFPEFCAYGASLPYLPRLLRRRARAEGYRRIGFEHDLDRYLLTYGYFLTAVRVLEGLRPKLVLLSNDHTMETRTLEHAANRLGIPTAYVQHASVTKGFPPLSFQLAFLDGRDAAEKYDLPTPGRPRVFLTGIPKADAARKRARARTGLARIGVCVNVLDPTAAVRSFVEELRALSPETELVLRPHPADTRPWRSVLPQVEHSDSRTEPPFDFLDRVDAVISGPSNIALEAALVGVRPVFVDFGELGRDHYGFVERGLCRRVGTAAAALNAIDPARAPEPAVGPLRDYCATIGTAYDGRSSQLVRELITEELAGGIDMQRWRQAEGFTHIEVYELRD